jgi:uncharacterized protein (DUF608 family)
MTIEAEIEGLERDERALEKAASALERLATVAERFYSALYPEKRSVREAVLTTVRTPAEEEIEETIQGSESTLEQWKDIGPREKAFIAKQKTNKSTS